MEQRDLLHLHPFLKISVDVGVCRTEAKDALSRCLCEAAGHSQTWISSLFPLPACALLEEQRTVCGAPGWERSLVILQDATATNRPQALH